MASILGISSFLMLAHRAASFRSICMSSTLPPGAGRDFIHYMGQGGWPRYARLEKTRPQWMGLVARSLQTWLEILQEVTH